MLFSSFLAAQIAPTFSTQTSGAARGYTLPPDKLQKAIEYAHARYWLHFAGSIWGIAVLAAILAFGLSCKFRDWAETASRNRVAQAAIFVVLLGLTNDLLNLPLGMYAQHLDLKFEQSIQSWPSWFWDWTKGELLRCSLGAAGLLLYAVIRRSPQRWWLYFWLAALPLLFIGMLVEPVLIEPLFYQFQPLAVKHPALVGDLEKVVARSGLAIPPDRMFEMMAREKIIR